MRRKRIPVMVAVGEKLRELRRERGITQNAIASRLHTDPSNVSHMEAGRQDLRVTQLVKLARLLEVRVCDLVSFLDTRTAA